MPRAASGMNSTSRPWPRTRPSPASTPDGRGRQTPEHSTSQKSLEQAHEFPEPDQGAGQVAGSRGSSAGGLEHGGHGHGRWLAAGGHAVLSFDPPARQQRILGGALAAGVLGLMLAAFLSVNAADRRAAQTGATGQALMQSQRLAKSVSQALIGRAQAFPDVAESAQVLATNV